VLREPDFIIGGATLGGTRALMNILCAHPQIRMPQKGDPHFFDPKKPVQRIRRPLHDIFEDVSVIRINNQIPPTRTLYGEQEYDATRAFEGAPHAKIIFTLRNPIIRAFMQFHNAKALGREQARNFESAIEAELMGVRTPDNSNRCWIYKNQYQKHLELWLSLFPKDKIKIMICEEWSNGLNHGIHALGAFLGLGDQTLSLDDAFGPKGRDHAVYYEKLLPKIIDYPPISEKTQAQLEDLFTVDINFVENFLGRKILSWS
jgi:Sulfotransferase domain